MSQKSALIVSHLEKEITLDKEKKLKILNDVNFKADFGEFISIVGPSGSGKTSLLRSISGLSQPTKGEVNLVGINPYTLKNSQLAKLRREKIGFIFQEYNLVPALPVLENILLPTRLSHKKVNPQAVTDLLKEMNFQASPTSYVASLSGGEQQKVAIARVLLADSQIIFADEPTGALDSASREIVFNLLKKLAQQSKCVIMVTHDIELAAETDRAILMRDGFLQKEFHHPTAQQLFHEINEGGN